MSKSTDREAERRISLYIELCKEVYKTNEHGIADLAGIPRATWTRNRKAHFGQMSAGFIIKLAALTGISISWLIAEGVE